MKNNILAFDMFLLKKEKKQPQYKYLYIEENIKYENDEKNQDDDPLRGIYIVEIL